jgi:hypothetical protein
MVKNDFFEMPVPPGWDFEVNEDQWVAMVHPDEEGILEIVPNPVDGEDPDGTYLSTVVESVLRQMDRIARDPQLKPPTKVVQRTFKVGMGYELRSESKDEESFLCQYCVVGPTVALYVQYQGPIAERRNVPSLEACLDEIRWIGR